MVDHAVDYRRYLSLDLKDLAAVAYSHQVVGRTIHTSGGSNPGGCGICSIGSE